MKIEPEKGYHEIEELRQDYLDGVDITKPKKNGDKKKLDFKVKEGTIKIENLYVKYRENLKWVLRGVSFDIKAGERLGIAGRTGSGKTTLVKSICGIFGDYRGEITIDGISLKDYPLKQYRRSISYISQDPLFFDTTIKGNIDVLGVHQDDYLVEVLKSVHLWEVVEQKGGLSYKLGGSDSNLSCGERQLLSLAKSIIEDKQIVIMDEGTANIDIGTENKIQKVIETNLSDKTLILIAHRLSTLKFCNK